MEESQLRHKQKQLMMLQNCDLPPPTNPCFLDTYNLAEALNRSQKRAREAERRRDEAIKERSHAMNALLSESMRLMAYRRYVMMLEFQIHNYLKTDEEDDAVATPTGRNRGTEPEKRGWKVGLIICVGLAGLGYALAFPFHGHILKTGKGSLQTD